LSISVHGSLTDIRALVRLFQTPPKVLLRRWWLPLPLAILPTVLVVKLGILAAPHVRPFDKGWRSIAIAAVLVALIIVALAVGWQFRHEVRWSHGLYPPRGGTEAGWYLAEAARGRRIMVAVIALPAVAFQAWLQVDDAGSLLDVGGAIATWIAWAGFIRVLIAAAAPEPAVAVTATGVYNGPELWRWEQIGRLWVEQEDLVGAVVNGRRRFLDIPHSSVDAVGVFGVINYYFKRPHERTGIAVSPVRRP
jgi:hypothetical protein